jgi:hypothetical protein
MDRGQLLGITLSLEVWHAGQLTVRSRLDHFPVGIRQIGFEYVDIVQFPVQRLAQADSPAQVLVPRSAGPASTLHLGRGEVAVRVKEDRRDTVILESNHIPRRVHSVGKVVVIPVVHIPRGISPKIVPLVCARVASAQPAPHRVVDDPVPDRHRVRDILRHSPVRQAEVRRPAVGRQVHGAARPVHHRLRPGLHLRRMFPGPRLIVPRRAVRRGPVEPVLNPLARHCRVGSGPVASAGEGVEILRRPVAAAPSTKHGPSVLRGEPKQGVGAAGPLGGAWDGFERGVSAGDGVGVGNGVSAKNCVDGLLQACCRQTLNA